MQEILVHGGIPENWPRQKSGFSRSRANTGIARGTSANTGPGRTALPQRCEEAAERLAPHRTPFALRPRRLARSRVGVLRARAGIWMQGQCSTAYSFYGPQTLERHSRNMAHSADLSSDRSLGCPVIERVAGSYSSPSQYSAVVPGLANMMSSSWASLARTFPVSRYSITSPRIVEESMRTRIGESVRLMI